MAKGFSLSIAADTRSFTTAIKKGIQEPLEDAAEILEDIGREGGRDIGEVEDAARDAQRDTVQLKDEYKKLQQEIRETGKKAKTDFAEPSSRATKEVSEDLREVQNEAKANAAEMFSSFDGSFESIADAAQGTLGGLVSGFGGLPMIAATAAGAAGLGLVTAELTKQWEQADELKQSLVDAYSAAASEGRDYLDEAQIIARANEIIFDPERFKKASEDAKTLGIDVTTIIRGQAGDLEALETISRLAGEAEQDRLDIMANDDSAAAALSIELNGIRDVADEYRALQDQNQENSRLARISGAVREQVEQEAQDAIRKTRDVEQERWDRLAERYTEANGRTVNIPVNVDTTPADASLRRWFENPRNIRVNIDARDFAGRRVV